MPKLFVAVDLPRDATSRLVGIQPPPTAGVRLVSLEQMHLTLHFIGETNLEQVADGLQAVVGSSFPLFVDVVGRFASAAGSVTLWAGVRVTSELLRLYDAIATALAPTGFQPEARPYSPHITLARCERGVPMGFIEEFVARNAQFELPSIPITEFVLYSSEFVGGVPKYRRERSFRLQ